MTDVGRRSVELKHRVITRSVTLERDGERVVPAAVCPRRLAVLSVEECGRCQHFAGLCVNPSSGAPFMRCSFDEAPFFEPASELESSGPPIADLMTRSPARIGLDMSLSEVLREPLGRVAAAAVVADGGVPIGLLTRADVLERLHGPTESAFRVRDMMLSKTFMVSDYAPAAQVAALMAYEQIPHVLVVADSGELVGIVGALDFARWIACRSGYVVPSDR
jgi:CBS domain-containing protein